MIRIKSSEFFEEQLNLSEVWTWQSDLNSSEDSLVPVPLTEEALVEADSLLIHATIFTASGTRLNGLIVYRLGDDDIFALEVLSGRSKFTVNRYLPDLSLNELKRLATFLNQDIDSLLPLRYVVVPKELFISGGTFSF